MLGVLFYWITPQIVIQFLERDSKMVGSNKQKKMAKKVGDLQCL